MAERSVKYPPEKLQFRRISCAMHTHTEEEALNDRSSETESEDFNCNSVVTHKLKKNASETLPCKPSGIFYQFLVTGVVMIGAAGFGMPIGYSAILLPQLKSPNETLQITEEIGSWIASIHSAATPLGSLMSGIMMDLLGPKTALQTAMLPLMIGWTLIAFCQNHGMLLLGRLIAGASVGLFAAPSQVLIGEISDSRVRGVFSSVPMGSYSFGILMVYILGASIHWRYVAGMSLLLPLISATLFFFLPESPVWLIRKKRMDKAKRAAVWLKGGNEKQALEEIDQITDRVKSRNLQDQYAETTISLLLKPQVLKPFVIINIFTILQILSGTYLIIFYAVDILSHIGGEEIDEFLAAVLTAGVRFIFTIIASIMLAILGRRTIALNSAIGTAMSALCLGTFVYFEQSNCPTNGYFAAICILFYVAFNTMGLMVLPGVMIGELYPARVRGMAGSLTFCIFHISLFTVAKTFPHMKNLVGVHGVFWIFGIASMLLSIFSFLMLPETKGKTLNEIEDYFLQDNVMWLTRNRKLSIEDDASLQS